MTAAPLRVGIVGANARRGWSRKSHVPALLALPEYELAAVCTSSRATADEAAASFGAARAYADHRELVADDGVDVVAVSVRVPLHRDVVVAALEAGKHVYCEWPLGATTAEAEEMASLAAERGLTTVVGLQARADPALLALRELVLTGYVGDVLTCVTTLFLPGLLRRGEEKAWMAADEAGANGFTIVAGHALDALLFCVEEFHEVSARLATQVPVWRTRTGTAVDVTAPDTVKLHGILRNGAVASLQAGMVPWHGTGWRIEIYGREGTLVAEAPGLVEYGGIRLRGAPSDEAELRELEVPGRFVRVPAGLARDERFNVAQMYRRLAAAIDGRDEVDADFDLALRRHRLLDALRLSSRTGTTLTIQSDGRPTGG